MAEPSLKFTVEECEFLVGILQLAQKNALIEEHRTRGPSYREYVLHNEELIAALLKKLRQSAG